MPFFIVRKAGGNIGLQEIFLEGESGGGKFFEDVDEALKAYRQQKWEQGKSRGLTPLGGEIYLCFAKKEGMM